MPGVRGLPRVTRYPWDTSADSCQSDVTFWQQESTRTFPGRNGEHEGRKERGQGPPVPRTQPSALSLGHSLTGTRKATIHRVRWSSRSSPGFAMTDLPRLLRKVYAAAAGGTPDDWRELASVMAEEVRDCQTFNATTEAIDRRPVLDLDQGLAYLCTSSRRT